MSILERMRAKEKAEKRNTFGQRLKRFLLGTTLTIGTIALSPAIYEAAHISIKKSNIENAITKITTEKAHLCLATGAKSLNALQRQKLSDIANNVYTSKIIDITDIGRVYESGLKRFASFVPGKTTLADAANKHFSVPGAYLVDDYAADIDEISPYLDKVASLGIGVCFDEGLEKKNLGSAYSPQTGMISLNPNLDQNILSIHLHRQLNNLNNSFVAPYTELLQALKADGTRYSTLKKVAKISNNIIQKDVTALKKDADPNIDSFISIKPKNYQLKLQNHKI